MYHVNILWDRLGRVGVASLICYVVVSLVVWVVYGNAAGAPLYLDSNKLEVIVDHAQSGSPCSSVPSFESGLGRFVALYSFCLEAKSSGEQLVVEYRNTNVLIHLINGLLVFLLGFKLLQLAGLERSIAPAAVLASCWLILPVHVSSVLYVIQRMTLLATFFSLIALVCFCFLFRGRGAMRRLLWLPVCVSVLLACFSKETGILCLVYIGVIWFCFRENSIAKTSWVVVSVVMMSFVCLLGLWWGGFLDYSSLPYSLEERLMTQPRVLFYYLSQIFLPIDGDVGLFQDDFVVSTGFMSPPTTIISIGLVLGILLLCILKPSPVTFGGAFFMAGHLLESTVLPLEMVYLHRNYLPSFGLLFLVVGVVARWNKEFFVLGAAFLYLIVLVNRVGNWSQEESFYYSANKYHPGSVRAATGVSQRLVGLGRFKAADDVLVRLSDYNKDQSGSIGLQRLYIACLVGNVEGQSRLYEDILSSVASYPAKQFNQALFNVIDLADRGGCAPLNKPMIVSSIDSLLDVQNGAVLLGDWDYLYFKAAIRFSFGQEPEGFRLLNDAFVAGEVRAGMYMLEKKIAFKDIEGAILLDKKLRSSSSFQSSGYDLSKQVVGYGEIQELIDPIF